jgi:hypothetical protein
VRFSCLGGGIGVHPFNRLDRQNRRRRRSAASDSLQTSAMPGQIDKFRHPRLQRSGAKSKEDEKEQKRNNGPKIEMRSVELAVNDDAKRDETDDYGCGNEPIAQPDAGQSVRAAVIFSHRLQNDAPPKVPVDLDVPLIPASVDRVTPAFFFEQLKNRAEQMMAIPCLVTPKTPTPQAATRFGASW